MKEIDWANLSFGYMRTDYNVRINFRNGKWGELEVSSEEYLNLHMAATCLHYGQEAFEGLKAFRGKDGKVRIFRLEENAARLQSTCQGILMAELPTERFKEAILKVVKLNERFIPPYETGASRKSTPGHVLSCWHEDWLHSYHPPCKYQFHEERHGRIHE